jgi:hypothetical protein
VKDKNNKSHLSSYYYKELFNFYKYNIQKNSTILYIGSYIPRIIEEVEATQCYISDIRNKTHKDLSRETTIISKNNTLRKFDYILLPDTISILDDVQKFFSDIKKNCKPKTRIIINFYNYAYNPILLLFEKLGLKTKQKHLNWLDLSDIENILDIEGFEVIKKGKKVLLPIYIPLLSDIVNRYIAPLPIINSFCFVNYLITRQVDLKPEKLKKVSVVVPARNEKGNIEKIVKGLSKVNKQFEIIFVEGWSTDGTYEQIVNIAKKYNNLDIKYLKQKGKGKADAVRLGFSIANGDILTILDADLTVPPKDLQKFINALKENKGEYINGTRLVYPLEKDSMCTLNYWGNKFFSIAFTWLLGQTVKDTLCGTKAISRSNYNKLVANRSYFGEFDPFGDFDLIFGASKLNLKFVEIPIRYRARTYGSTNISRFKHGLLLLKMLFYAIFKLKFV